METKSIVKIRDKSFETYISQSEIDEIISNIALAINRDYADKDPIFIAVLNGSFMFAADLMKKISVNCELSFVKLASYHGTESSGKVDELIGLSDEINNRDIIILEDIVDTGTTLEFLMDVLKTYELKSLSVCTLLLKPDVFNKKYNIHYVGKNIPNKFVVGYGLDYYGQGRNLPELYQLTTHD